MTTSRFLKKLMIKCLDVITFKSNKTYICACFMSGKSLDYSFLVQFMVSSQVLYMVKNNY